MPVIPIGFGQINFIFTGQACPTGAQVTLGFDNDAAHTPAEAALIASTAWNTNIQPVLSEFCTISGVLVKLGPNSTGPSALLPTSLAGSVTGDPEVANTSILVRKVTDLGGRAGRGRMYVPGAGQALFQEDSRMTPGDDDIYTSKFEDFRGDLETGGMPQVVLHGLGSPITTPTPIVGYVADALAATQRRRLRR